MEKINTEVLKREAIFEQKSKKKKRTTGDTFLNILLVILLIASLFMLAYKTLTADANVRGQSMENTLMNDERLLYEKWTNYIGDYNKKDILILKENTLKNADSEDTLIVKRLIAKAGDTVEFTTDGKPIVNGEKLEEPYIKEQISTRTANFSTVIDKTNEKYHTNFDVNTNEVPDGYYFVMGDNRNNSSDSRVFGLFKKEDIVGHVIYSWSYHHFY